jgi:hypothetical protein
MIQLMRNFSFSCLNVKMFKDPKSLLVVGSQPLDELIYCFNFEMARFKKLQRRDVWHGEKTI